MCNKYEPYMANIFNEIAKHRYEQDTKHGPRSVGNPKQDALMKLAILGEEYGEIAKAIMDGDRENLREEYVQVATCAVAALVCIDFINDQELLSQERRSRSAQEPVGLFKQRSPQGTYFGG